MQTPLSHAHEQAFGKATAFMAENLGQPLRATAIARHVGISDSGLRTIFRNATGAGLLPYLMNLRLNRAKDLLLETDLSIAEIALETGFNSHPHFTGFFRKRAGIAPLRFRKQARQTGSAMAKRKGDWLRDDFAGNSLAEWWRVLSGECRVAQNQLQARGSEYIAVSLERLLPENFGLAFEVRFLDDRVHRPSDLNLVLGPAATPEAYNEFTLGAHANTVAEARHSRLGLQWNAAGVLRPNKWQKVELELRDDTTVLRLDSREVFRIRDPFPPPYARRNRLRIASWRSVFQLRDLAVRNIGFSGVLKPVRQGDYLYNAQLPDAALASYERQLTAGVSFGDRIELEYKIGMCYLAQKRFEEGRGKLQRVAAQPETELWSQQARLAIIQSQRSSGHFDAFVAGIRAAFRAPALRDGIRQIIDDACLDLDSRGFYDRLVLLRQTGLEHEPTAGLGHWFAVRDLALALRSANQNEAALGFLDLLHQSAEVPHSLRVLALQHTAQSYTLQGLFGDSEKATRQIETMTTDPSDLCLCDSYRAMNLRGQGAFEDALKLLNATPAKHPMAKGFWSYAHLSAAHIQCGLGKTEKARELIALANEVGPKTPELRPGFRSMFFAAPEIVVGNYRKAAELKIEDVKAGTPSIRLGATFLVQAGALLETCGDAKRARQTWMEAAMRYPAQQCNFLGPLALRLAKKEPDQLEAMPYATWPRTETFYIVSLMYAKRGNMVRARQLLEACVKEDPTLRWPAVLAKKELGPGP